MATTQTNLPRRHQRRTVRRVSTATPDLGERDCWLLDVLGTFRFVTTGQLLRLGFASSRSAANKRLRRLFDAGLIRAWLRCLESENLYSLTAAGRSALGHDREQRIVHVPRGLDRDLAHTLAINDVRVALATTLPTTDADLVWWRSDWDLRPRRHSRLIPDALFLVRWTNGQKTLFSVEVDRRTKSAASFLRKVLAYCATAYRSDGLESGAIILVVGCDPAWLLRYRVQLAHAALSRPVVFATLANVVAHGAPGEIWCTADDDETYALPHLATLPNGSEGSRSKTAWSAWTSVSPLARVPHPETAP